MLSSHISKILKLLFAFEYSKNLKIQQLVESIIFSRLNYCKNLIIDLPQYQIRRMIKLQKSYASFITRKFCSLKDVISLKYLLAPERIDFTVLKTTFKGLLTERKSSNFQTKIKKKKRELRQKQKPVNKQ